MYEMKCIIYATQKSPFEVIAIYYIYELMMIFILKI